jgi:hypothetical protein
MNIMTQHSLESFFISTNEDDFNRRDAIVVLPIIRSDETILSKQQFREYQRAEEKNSTMVPRLAEILVLFAWHIGTTFALDAVLEPQSEIGESDSSKISHER